MKCKGGILMKLNSIRYFLVFLIFISLFAGCGDSDNEKDTFSESNKQAEDFQIDITFIDDIGRSDMAIDGNGNLYLTDKDKIHVMDYKGNKVFEISENLYSCYNITTGDQYIYAVDLKGKFIDNEYHKLIKEYDIKGNLLNEYPLKDINIRKMFYMDGNIFFLQSAHQDYNNKSITYLNLESGKYEKIDMENVINIAKYKDNKILVYKECTHAKCTHAAGDVAIYDYVKKQLVENNHWHYNLPRMEYDEVSDAIFYWTDNQIGTISLKTSEQLTFYNNYISSGQKIVGKNGFYYIYDRKNKKLLGVKFTKNNYKMNNLKIIDSSFITDRDLTGVIDGFAMLYPNTNIVFEEIPAEKYDEILSKKLMAGDSDFDIFSIMSMKAHNYIKYDSMEDLNSYPEIVQLFHDMFDGFLSLSSYKDKIFGIPMYFKNSGIVFKINRELKEKLNIQIPNSNWTWDDFYNIGRKIKQLNGNFYIMQMSKREFWFFCMQNIYDSIYTNRIEGNVNYKTQEYEDMLIQFKKFYDEKLILDETRNFGVADNILFQSTISPQYDIIGDFISVPVLNKKKSYPVLGLSYFCINKNSKNKDLSAAFLKECISKSTQSEDKMVNSPILYKDQSLYKESKYHKLISSNNFYKFYEELVKYSKRDETLDLSNILYPYVEEYIDGKISVDAAIQKIDRKIRMIIEE